MTSKNKNDPAKNRNQDNDNSSDSQETSNRKRSIIDWTKRFMRQSLNYEIETQIEKNEKNYYIINTDAKNRKMSSNFIISDSPVGDAPTIEDEDDEDENENEKMPNGSENETDGAESPTNREKPKPELSRKRRKMIDWKKFLLPKPDDEDEEVDGFILIKDPDAKKGKSLKWQLRKYFIANPELEAEKYREGDDIMIEDGFVFIDESEKQAAVSADVAFKESVIDFTAGSIGGLMQVYVSQPFDTIKVKLQTFPKLYKNMFSCLKYTYQTDGIIRGLYAGTVPAAVASIAENSVLFAAYGRCQSLVANIFEIENSAGLSVLGDATSGFIAAFFTALILCPAELIKCKMQAVNEMKHYVSKDSKVATINPFMVTKDILETEGIRGLYRGLGTTFVREMPGLFFFFGGYEGARTLFAEPGQTKDDIGPLKTMCAGAIGGVSLWTFTFPADVIKTRIQVGNLEGSMIAVGMQIIRKEGFLALYNGLLPSIIRTVPASATLFWIYEYTKKLLSDLAGIPT
ncbi:mitochondrial ornithine transporter 1-like [Glossina fuscipes]|uniref:Mitochondrial ornithine transporter 1-like n=1 Tax=Glossina fuscipes TaxID=7396 RepID=A0A9C5ZKC8_9MUSC|nr:mitochondrial ornithine transporter 1-like [Glossina fuscipes]